MIEGDVSLCGNRYDTRTVLVVNVDAFVPPQLAFAAFHGKGLVEALAKGAPPWVVRTTAAQLLEVVAAAAPHG